MDPDTARTTGQAHGYDTIENFKNASIKLKIGTKTKCDMEMTTINVSNYYDHLSGRGR